MTIEAPSKVTDRFWVYAWNPKATGEVGPRNGKWVITIPEAKLDESWTKIVDALKVGRLGDACKARTAVPHPFLEPDGQTVLIVFTKDFLDVKDRNRILSEIYRLGFHSVRYRTDQESLNDWKSCLPDRGGL